MILAFISCEGEENFLDISCGSMQSGVRHKKSCWFIQASAFLHFPIMRSLRNLYSTIENKQSCLPHTLEVMKTYSSLFSQLEKCIQEPYWLLLVGLKIYQKRFHRYPQGGERKLSRRKSYSLSLDWNIMHILIIVTHLSLDIAGANEQYKG